MLTSQKHLFTLDPSIHYLNCAYKSPLLKAGEQAAMEALIRGRNPSNIYAEDFFKIAEEVRGLFGKLVNCSAENVAIIPSVSYGLTSVLNNVHAKTGMQGITLEKEFPSGYFALKQWCEENQNELVVISPDKGLSTVGENWNDKLLQSIDEKTSVVLISAIHWMNGLKFDLARIGERCKEVGAVFIVDGSQSVVALKMDVQKFKINALVCAGYKWLFGPYSISLAFIDDAFENGRPLEQAWMNRTNAHQFKKLAEYDPNYKRKAGRYNMGEASNLVTMPIFKEGLSQLLNWGIVNIQNYSRELIQPLLSSLKERGAIFEEAQYFSNHLFSLPLPMNSDPEVIKTRLQEANIIVSIRGESLRVSVNVFNDERDIGVLSKMLQLGQ